MTFRANELPGDLRIIYLKFLRIDQQLADGTKNHAQALAEVSALKVEDAYENVWSVDPGSGSFTMTTPTGTQTPHADPATFHSARGYVDDDYDEEDAAKDDGEFAGDYEPEDEEDAEEDGGFSSWPKGKKIAAIAGGALALLLLLGFVTSLGGGDDGTEAGEVTEAGVPSTQEAAAALGGLSRGDVATTVPDATALEAEWLTAQMTGLKAQGLLLRDATTEDGGQLVVVNAQGNVVALAPVTWDKSGEDWVLVEVPVFQPATGEEDPITPDSAPGVTIPGD